ncbi:MAG: porin family protein [Acidobacteriota bacterium]
MRKFLLLAAVVVVLLSSPSLAQNEREVYIGFKGGISVPQLSSKQSNELSRDYKSRLAPNFGGFVEVGLKEKLAFQVELNFAGQGGKRDGIQPISIAPPGLPTLPEGFYYYGDFKNVAKLNYLEVPLMLKYKFGEQDKKRLYLNGGVYYGGLLTAKQVTSGNSTLYLDRDGKIPLLLPPAGTPLPPISFDATTEIKSDLHSHNFGLTGGGGLEIPHGKNYIQIDARIAYGLTTLQKDTVRNGKSRTGNFVISIGYAFGLK